MDKWGPPSRTQPSGVGSRRVEPNEAEQNRVKPNRAELSRTQSEPRVRPRCLTAGQKLIVVFGATGAQGGYVARAPLKDGTFKACAVTWSPMKKEAKELKQRGAEVGKADQDNEPSLELALAGVYGAFVVTNFWEHCSKEKEIAWGKWLADLLNRLDLHHIIYSGLENMEQHGGRLEVLRLDGKGVVEEYFQKVGIPTMTIRLPLYFKNFLSIFKPQKVPQGDAFVLALPVGDTPVDGMAVEDAGPVVLCLLEAPEEHIGQVVVSAGKLTEAYATVLSQQTGETVEAGKISPEEHEKRGFPGAKEVAATCHFYAPKPDRKVDLTMKLHRRACTLRPWVADSKAAFDPARPPPPAQLLEREPAEEVSCAEPRCLSTGAPVEG
ncbi:LOW QUALITY PROTEIN: nmrA-like family domain-containing protein 1 [Phoenicopterus ruber ruber]